MAELPRSGIGDAPKRREDLRFVTGRGRYLDDLVFEGLAHAVVLRSPHAHAQITRIDANNARAAPGVLAVLTADDVAGDGLQPLRPSAEANVQPASASRLRRSRCWPQTRSAMRESRSR
jgi:carbon-monoxide dehydrogenase large subunit